MKRKHRLPLLLRLLVWIILLGILVYAGTGAYVCIQEGKVSNQLSPEMTYDAIIVLGAQVKLDGTPSVQLSWRLDAAIQAYEQHAVPIVVCGAQGKDEPMTEAENMRRYLTEHGIPESVILEDPDSFNTRQNLLNAGRLLAGRPEVKKVLVVTSDYHVPRAMALARDQGYDAEGLGSPTLPEYWLKNHGREALAWLKYWGVKYLHLPLE